MNCLMAFWTTILSLIKRKKTLLASFTQHTLQEHEPGTENTTFIHLDAYVHSMKTTVDGRIPALVDR